MSFLDDETTAGQISLGTRRLGLDPLLPRRRRQAAQQQQAPGYDILPSTMQPTPGVVSTPTDIAQVGVGQQLQQQGTTAAQVPNVFERYAETGAAPIGDFKRYLYPTSPTQEDEEQNDVIEAANEEFAQNFGYDPYDPYTAEGQFYSDQRAASEASAGRLGSLYSGLGLGAKTIAGLEAKALGGFGITSLGKGLLDSIQGKSDFESQIVNNIFEQAEKGKLTDTQGQKVTVDDVWSYFAQGEQESAYPSVDPSADLVAPPPAPLSSSQSFLGYDPGIDPSIPDAGDAGGGSDIGLPGYSGSTADFGLD